MASTLTRFFVLTGFALIQWALLPACRSGDATDDADPVVRDLGPDRVAELLAAAGWTTAGAGSPPAWSDLVVLGGFRLHAGFAGDVSGDARLLLPFQMPAQTAGDQDGRGFLALVAPERMELAGTSLLRLRLVSPAMVDPGSGELRTRGDLLASYRDPQTVQPDDGEAAGHSGEYLLIEAKKGITLVTGVASLHPADGSPPMPVTAALVSASPTPLVSLTDSKGRYLLVVPAGVRGTLTAHKAGLQGAAPATTEAVSREFQAHGTAGTLQAALDYRLEQMKTDLIRMSGDALVEKAGLSVVSLADGLNLVQAGLAFHQPALDFSLHPAPEQRPDQRPEVPTLERPAERDPPQGSPVMRHDPADTDVTHADLGCSGYEGDQLLPLVMDQERADDYSVETGVRGWRGRGDVRITSESADRIFGDPAAHGEQYLDGTNSYCLLTTGNQIYAETTDPAYNPGPAGTGQVSEIWQKVDIPADARSVQLRVAFFSQEFPKFIGAAYNDSFYIRFDESTGYLASGNLNDLAGIRNPELQAAVAACSTITGEDLAATCGNWAFTGQSLPGTLWNIQRSTQSPAVGRDYGCIPAGSADNKCYNGMVAPRLICSDLSAEDAGKTRTLRIAVQDAGDEWYDTALAVDTIVFSKAPCSDPGGRMTGEDLLTDDVR